MSQVKHKVLRKDYKKSMSKLPQLYAELRGLIPIISIEDNDDRENLYTIHFFPNEKEINLGVKLCRFESIAKVSEIVKLNDHCTIVDMSIPQFVQMNGILEITIGLKFVY